MPELGLRPPGAEPAWRWTGRSVMVAYVVALAVTLPDYGVTWDEVFYFEIGDRQLTYVLSGDRRYLELPPGFEAGEAAAVYGPLANIVAAITKRLAHDWWGGLAEDTARHAANVLFAALAVASLCAWVRVQGTRTTT